MAGTNEPLAETVPRDLEAGLVVAVVSVPLCLGVALASAGAGGLVAGLIAGVVGGVVVGLVSGSHTAVSGPAAGLAAVVAGQVAALGSFEAFLLAVVVAGVLQVGLAAVRAGSLADFVPTSVVRGLLAAVGVILVLTQLPYLFGGGAGPSGGEALAGPGSWEALAKLKDVHPGAVAVGVLAFGVLAVWARVPRLRRLPVPAALAVVVAGVVAGFALDAAGGAWALGPNQLVRIPDGDPAGLFRLPDFSRWADPAIYLAALTLAAVASVETLVTLKAVDRLDPRRRTSPPGRELLAQGVGNVVCGLLGGLPVTAVVARSSVNVSSGARTKLAAVVAGALLAAAVVALPAVLNRIPLACLAAVLIATGGRLAGPGVVRKMWAGGPSQFVPFVVTVVVMVLTDPLVGILAGFAVSVGFVLRSNLNRPLRQVVERHPGGEVVRLELADQVTFLNRAAVAAALDAVPRGGRVLIDATHTDYVDPDVLGLIREFDAQTGPARGIQVSLGGFRDRYDLADRIRYVDTATRDVQAALTPAGVLELLKEGNARFRSGERLTRDLGRQVAATAAGQHPLAVVLSCIDSRSPAELLFDLGLGDVFVVRVAGNVVSRKILGSMEYGCAVAGAKLVLVLGHTRCGAVGAAVDLAGKPGTPEEATGCDHIGPIIANIQESVDPRATGERDAIVDAVARRNVARSVARVRAESKALARLEREGKIAVVGAVYDVATGDVEFLADAGGRAPS